ncbi:hypothetical protein [Streptococcus uberis]|uniref:hypothetical protein n=1 Tax=Streptococcus uberis TaxID=1349 RepID=UPI0012B66545|nr:hypothetical protein [Streptococcus uberis]MTB55904.1 hypothetical protein [Streptococcus uberis]
MSSNQEKSYEVLLQTINAASQLPFVKVDREEFLRNEFKGNPHLDYILENGPQSVFTSDSLLRSAEKIITDITRQTSTVSFVAGLPSNPVSATIATTADITQYFGYALNMAQKIAYLFGEDNLFEGDKNQLSDEVKYRVISYLGVMFGVSGSNAMITKFSKNAGANIGKKVAQKTLTKTIWYNPMKKIGSIIGTKITKKSIGNLVTKSVPIVGGMISGGLTYATFKPMGKRLAMTFYKNLNGDFDTDSGMTYNDNFKNTVNETDEL